jgi:O-antigen/teichoic acid export membrane protein
VGFTNIKKGLHYAAKFVSREHALSLLDQGIVSATGFLSTLMIAHWADASQLGIYALGLSVLVSVVAFQDSLILQPYTIQRFHSEEEATVQAGASLMLSAFFSAGSVLILMVAASVLTWRASADTIAITWTVAGVMPFALTRDFARRFDFAHLAVGRVVLLDFGTAVVQLSCLGFARPDRTHVGARGVRRSRHSNRGSDRDLVLSFARRISFQPTAVANNF